MTTTGAPTTQNRISTPGDRIVELDVLRGVALCGILVINVIQQLVFVRAGQPRVFPLPISLIFYERFLAVFGVLFGVGFGLFMQRARARTDRPRLVLARRLGVLLVIGAVHFVLHRGEVLSSYAVFGLVFLLPVSYLRGRWALVVAVVLLFVGPQIEPGYGIIPGLLVLGYALAELGVPEALHRRPGRIAVGLAVVGVPAIAYAVVRLVHGPLGTVDVLGGGVGGSGDLLGPMAALATGLAYCGVVLLARRTPMRRVLDGVVAPMGRMALTNYLAQTVLFLTVGSALRIDSTADAAAITGLTVGILVVEAIWSPMWLRRFRYGPAEWVWRCLTWGQRAPLRRRTTAPTAPAAA